MFPEFFDSLSRDLIKMLFNADDYNVIIKVGKSPNIKHFKAHLCLLRARSPYFYSALSNNWAKIEGNVIVFEKNNISPHTFQRILEYLYSGIMDFDQLQPTCLMDLLAAADELLLTELVEYSKEYLLEFHYKWILQFPFQVLNHTISHLDSCKDLRELGLNTICENPTAALGNSAFLEINEPILISILQRDDLRIDEIDLWDYLIQWGIAYMKKHNHDISERVSEWSYKEFSLLKSTLQNPISFIKFRHINPNEIPKRLKPFNKILPHNILNDFENQSIKYKALIDSEIIKIKHAALVARWIGRKENENLSYRETPSHEFRLLLRGSRDGFSARKFHELCDYRGETVVLMKVAGTKEIIGGYNPVNWRGGFLGNWTKTNDSFIFFIDKDGNLKNSKISRILPENSVMALFGADVRGPCFGNRDLWMSNFNNLSKKCMSQKSFYEKSIIDSPKFDIEDYEVFQIIMGDKKSIHKEERKAPF